MVDQVIKNTDINKNKKGITVLDIPSNVFIKELSKTLKEKSLIKVPDYTQYVKCSYSNELAPTDEDWFYHKAAAILRQIYVTKSKTLGVGALKVKFGKKYRRGTLPGVTSKHSGKIIRDIITQFKNAEFIENYQYLEGTTLGLSVTKKGKSNLDKVAAATARKN